MRRILLGCAMALAALPAAAQETLRLTAGASVTSDDNIFKQADNAGPTSDRITAGYIGLNFDKSHQQQRFVAEVTQTAYRYDLSTFLDYDGTNYRAAWHWWAHERLTGTLSIDHTESLVNYADFRDATEQNLRTVEHRALSADYWVTGGWNLTSTLFGHDSTNSVPFPTQRGYTEHGGNLGVRYLAGTSSSLEVRRRWVKGEYVEGGQDPANLIDDAYWRFETEALATWVLTGRSALEGRVAHIDYDSANFDQRDFSGFAGRLGWRWSPAARLTTTVAASRDLSPSSDAFAYRVEDRLALGGTYELGERIALRAGVYLGTSEYRQPVLPSAGAPRKERPAGWSLGLNWEVHRLVTLTASAQHQKRTSNDAAYDFHSTTATLGASFAY